MIKKIACTMLALLFVCMIFNTKAYAVDISNYNFDGMNKVSEKYTESFRDGMKYLPDYLLNCYLKNGGQIRFVDHQIYGDDHVGGVYNYDKADTSYNLIEIRVNPDTDGVAYDGEMIATTLMHELGHYYGVNYISKLSEKSQNEILKTSEYNKKYNNSKCYNYDESFAVQFDIMYSKIGDTCWGTNYSVPYDELEHTVKAEMKMNDTDCRIKNDVINVY